ncbi:MAG TPA: endonuclease III [Thermoanaerobaculia bacterium]|nr:endonuclease III [Thermoanaerobaculia bacterium]
MDLKKRAAEVNKRLKKQYPDARVELDFRNPFELLIATILAAQSTDQRVNIVTKSLFRKYPDPRAFAEADLVEMETAVKQTGFFRNKAKAVVNCSKALVEKHGGEVPRTIEELVALPGVGRKTANVVLGNAYGIEAGVIVDTHVTRLSGRLGFTESADPVEIEQDLMKIAPRGEWTAFANRLILHGRRVCIARKPLCEECALNDICPSAEIATADRSSLASPKARNGRSATPSSPRPSRTRTSRSPRARKPSR